MYRCPPDIRIVRREAGGGFTLIEVMIAITIIMILATVTIPNLLRSRVQANESATIGNIRAITSAQVSFNSDKGRYAIDIADLVTASPAYLNHDFLKEPLHGYLFFFGGDENFYTLNANAVEYGVTGVRGFYTDASGVIRAEHMADADENSPVLQDR